MEIKYKTNQKRIIQGNRTLQSFASPEAVNNETLQREINTKVQKERIRTLRLTVGSLYANSYIDDQGLKIKPSLADVEEQYDYAGEISIDEIFETYKDAAGNYDPLYQNDLKEFLKRVDLSNEEIEAYGLREFVIEPVKIQYDKFIKSKEKPDIIPDVPPTTTNVKEQIPMTTTENVDNSSVSDETTDEKPSDTGNEDEFKKANERDEIVNPKDLRKSQLPLNDVQIAQSQEIISDVISKLRGTD